MNNNNKRIAKNTVLLYFRMILVMIVQLYTVRVILEQLGVSDYGVYNVVGGVVYMFSFLSATMATASQRYFAFGIGMGNQQQLRNTFSMTIIIYFLFGVAIFCLLETLGLWFLYNRINIPLERLDAAKYVYQFVILSFLLIMLQSPFNALVIAHERMNFFAYVGIIEAILKLLVVYLLMLGDFDKLILYSALNLGVTFITAIISISYCLYNFKESHFQWYWQKSHFIEIITYSGWNLFGALAALMNNQGVNIVLNIFFGPVVNAARAVAFQISTALSQFVHNFMTATRPQITKYFSQGEVDKMLDLVLRSSKFSFFLLLFISLPILFEMPFILKLWLGQSPEYTVQFARIIIITAMFDSMSYPIQAAFQATGRIQRYQAIVGTMIMLNVPISYGLFKLGCPPQVAFYVILCNVLLCVFVRLVLLRKIIPKLSIEEYLAKVLRPILLVLSLCIIVVYVETLLLPESFIRFCITTFVSCLIAIVTVFLLGIEKDERVMVKKWVLKKRGKNTLP